VDVDAQDLAKQIGGGLGIVAVRIVANRRV
jgi:hypothetical protein